MKHLEGTIQDDGTILGDDNKIYHTTMKYGDTILLAAYSFSRVKINNVKGKRVSFIVNEKTNYAYNFNIIPETKQ